jgi:hypothetical protein
VSIGFVEVVVGFELAGLVGYLLAGTCIEDFAVDRSLL